MTRIAHVLALLCVFVCATAALGQNLLTNTTFDHDLSGWIPNNAEAGWDSRDANPFAAGSARLTASNGAQTTLAQCVPVASVAHHLITNIYVPSGQSTDGKAFFIIQYYPNAGCTGTFAGGSNAPTVTEQGKWLTRALVNVKPFTDSTAQSARVMLIAQAPASGSFTALFDTVRFAPSSSFQRRLVIPVAASVTGANNSAFRSDLWLFNQSSDNPLSLTLTFRCYAGSPCTSVEKSVTIPSRHSIQYKDVVTTLFTQPQTGGAIEIEYDSFLGSAAATSRLYSPATGPSYGFAMVVRPSTEGLRHVVLPGLGWNGGVLSSGFRTNIGFYNPNDTPANVTVTLFRPDGTILGTTGTTVAARTAYQINNIFNVVNASGVVTTNAYATVASDIGIFSYASVLDNATSDASYFEGIFDTAN